MSFAVLASDAVRLAVVVQPGGLVVHQPRAFELGVGLRERKLQALVCANRLSPNTLRCAA